MEVQARVYGSRPNAEAFVYELCCFLSAGKWLKQRIDVSSDKKYADDGVTELLLLSFEAEYQQKVMRLAERCSMRFREGWF